MLEVFRKVEEFDSIAFVPNPDGDDSEVKIEIANLKNKGEKLNGSVMGDMFDIILFRLNEEDDIVDLERFEGILIDARVYVSRMIKEDWYGMVSRKTTTSGKLTDEVFANLSDISYNKT
jgi:hypothetical protein